MSFKRKFVKLICAIAISTTAYASFSTPETIVKKESNQAFTLQKMDLKTLTAVVATRDKQHLIHIKFSGKVAPNNKLTVDSVDDIYTTDLHYQVEEHYTLDHDDFTQIVNVLENV